MKRGLGLALCLGLLLVGLCIPLGAEDEPGPTHTVERGDTLSGIARARSVSVEELRAWNGLEGDVIHPGELLQVGAARRSPGRSVLQRFLESRRAGPELAPAAEVDSGGATGEKRGSGSTGSASAARSRSRARGPAGPAPLDGLPPPEPSWAPLVLPPAKPCLAADAGLGGGGGGGPAFGRSQGLDSDQISPAVSAFQEQALRCFEGREGSRGEVLLRLVVGCDGRVRDSVVQSDGTGSPGFAACVADVFRYAAFPAHARDEVEFSVPLHFVPDTSAE